MRTFDIHDSHELVLSDIRELLRMLVLNQADRPGSAIADLYEEFAKRRMVNE